MTRVAPAALTATASAAVALAMMAFALPAHAQKKEYDPWVYKEMVPTGPYMRNLEQAQPLPAPPPSHWGAISKKGEFRAGMAHYGTDVQKTTRHYSNTHSLTPPPVDVTKKAAPLSGDAPPPPRTVERW
ncbi:hypothetical protein [Azospirillum sp. TSO35-2]|uniref:hypothetical protein n=1 Tax=Azospirillum sp. TSO35-2 TaxID=716796 RepID=UPI000D60B353|nr:hypothetical protein [Azospirillum sp. TSO35-2]PWC33235.1 hypothetical protein TSO352_22280 [Azospirillum sp. TSO35-2]